MRKLDYKTRRILTDANKEFRVIHNGKLSSIKSSETLRVYIYGNGTPSGSDMLEFNISAFDGIRIPESIKPVHSYNVDYNEITDCWFDDYHDQYNAGDTEKPGYNEIHIRNFPNENNLLFSVCNGPIDEYSFGAQCVLSIEHMAAQMKLFTAPEPPLLFKPSAVMAGSKFRLTNFGYETSYSKFLANITAGNQYIVIPSYSFLLKYGFLNCIIYNSVVTDFSAINLNERLTTEAYTSSVKAFLYNINSKCDSLSKEGFYEFIKFIAYISEFTYSYPTSNALSDIFKRSKNSIWFDDEEEGDDAASYYNVLTGSWSDTYNPYTNELGTTREDLVMKVLSENNAIISYLSKGLLHSKDKNNIALDILNRSLVNNKYKYTTDGVLHCKDVFNGVDLQLEVTSLKKFQPIAEELLTTVNRIVDRQTIRFEDISVFYKQANLQLHCNTTKAGIINFNIEEMMENSFCQKTDLNI